MSERESEDRVERAARALAAEVDSSPKAWEEDADAFRREARAALAAADARPTETVRVRIAVAVDQSGNWSAYGANDEPERAMKMTASDSRSVHDVVADFGNETVEAFHWVEANIPLPIAAVIEGEVSPEAEEET